MKRISWLALLLAVVMMLGVFAGCASEPTAPTETPVDTPASTDTPAEAPADEPADAPAEAPADEPADEPTEAPADEPEAEPEAPAAEVNNVTMNAYGYDFVVPQAAIDGVTLPLVSEPATISLFMQWTNNYVGFPMDMYVYQEMEKRTGVTVDYTCVSANEQFQIMYASQDYDDIIKAGATSYVGGIDKAIEDEIYVDAADYAHLTPVFNAWQTIDPEYAKDCKTDSGAYYFNSVQSGREPAWCGASVRADWLEDCGLDIPVTFDDWHEMLTAFKDQKGATKALVLNPTGYEEMSYTLTAGYGIAPGWYHIDGEIHFGIVEEGMREYVTMMNQWYSEGLVDTDFPGSQNAFVNGADYFSNGYTGAWDWAPCGMFDLWVMMNGGEGKMIGVASPVKNEGDEYHLRRNNGISGGVAFFITTAAVERGVDELAAKWMDYRYTLDCSYLLTFGEEGVDWTMGEDGIPHFTEAYYNHPDGKATYHDMKMQDVQSSFYIWWREFDTQAESAMNAYATWQNSSDAAYVLPTYGISLTAEESEEYSSPYNDIKTYVEENIPLFIRGDRSLDTWDAFVEDIYAFGLQDCIDIYQAALDRYNAR